MSREKEFIESIADDVDIGELADRFVIEDLKRREKPGSYVQHAYFVKDNDLPHRFWDDLHQFSGEQIDLLLQSIKESSLDEIYCSDIAKRIYIYGAVVDDLELSGAADRYTKRYPWVDLFEYCMEDFIGVYFHQRDYGDNELEDELEETLNDSDEHQMLLFEAYKESMSVWGHEGFVERFFDRIYNSAYFGEALTEAFDYEDELFISKAAEAMYNDASDFEEWQAALAMAHTAGNKELTDKIMTEMITEALDDKDTAHDITLLDRLQSFRMRAEGLRDKMSKKLKIIYPENVLFSPYSGAYAMIKYRGEGGLYAPEPESKTVA